MNTIPEKQNQESNLKLLAAQRQLYSEAKRWLFISFVISILSVMIFSMTSTVFPYLQNYANFWAIIATLLDNLLCYNLQKESINKAAKIQQIFDSVVLELDWEKLKCGDKVPIESINYAYNSYKKHKKNIDNIKNWYSIYVRHLPIYQARIICQRLNANWDMKLRQRYSLLLIITMILLIILIAFIAMYKSISFTDFILNLSPLIPIIVFLLRQNIENKNSIKNSEKLIDNAQNLFDELKSGNFSANYLEDKSYQLQNSIYNNRRESPLIMDFFYELFRSKDDKSMDEITEMLIEELKN